jgi:hypothetical protein
MHKAAAEAAALAAVIEESCGREASFFIYLWNGCVFQPNATASRTHLVDGKRLEVVRNVGSACRDLGWRDAKRRASGNAFPRADYS